jgi:hypothetical protein
MDCDVSFVLILLGGDAAFGIWLYPQPIPIHENHPYS